MGIAKSSGMLIVLRFSKPNGDTGLPLKKSTRRWQRCCGLINLIAAALIVFSATLTAGILEIDREPINYKTAPVQDRIQLLKQRLEDGSTKLEWDEKHGWLPSMLKIGRASCRERV